MRLDEELNCFGLLGFGTGHAWGKANIRPDEKIDGTQGYCAKECPELRRCTLAHQTKSRIMFPRATKHFDRMLKDIGQQEASAVWRKMHPHTPIEPYALQMIANTEDGLAMAQTGAPKNRGALTLTWPRAGKP